MKISLLVIGRNKAGLDTFMSMNPHLSQECGDLRLLDNVNWKCPSQALLGNQLIDQAGGDVAGMLHDDVSIGPGDLERLGAAALAGKVVGIVGRSMRDVDGERGYVWGKNIQKDTPVSTLDGCSVFFPKTVKVRFDSKTFDKFHCVIEDFCLAASVAGHPVLVPALKAVGHRGGSASNTWIEEYYEYEGRLRQKWKGIPFRTV